MTPETWWYLDQLKRKRAHLESDIDRLENLLARPKLDRQTQHRLKLELDCVKIRLAKVKRGQLY